MRKYKAFLSILFLLWACHSQTDGFDSTSYDLYKESQFANGFAMIKDQFGRRMDPNHGERNYADGIMNASVMFGEMDLLKVKKQVIAQMNGSDVDEGGVWKPLYDAVRQSQGHEYEAIDAWVYWSVFNPQVDYSVIGAAETDGLTGVAILTALSRANVSYWHDKTMACLKGKMTPEEMQVLQKTWSNKTKECMSEYTSIINDMAAQIYLKLKELPQYQYKSEASS